MGNTKHFLIIFFCLSTFSSMAQSFDRYKDNINQYNAIRYYKIDYQLIVEKRIPFDTLQPFYFVVGIYINDFRLPYIDTFMKTGGAIFFENGKRVNLKGELSTLNFGNDINRLGVKGQLTDSEFNLLCSESIEKFTIIGLLKEFDKYQRKHIKEAIQKLRTEQF
jgi:hypothetical protein